MATEDDETTVNGSYAVTIPASVREDLDLEPIDMGETNAVEITEDYDWS
ncbi:AbrB/MazE/SpoVT family DNA-binding domain-containing protein [Halomarina pelagica]|nr:AbrB/MazE/SpoVT family DNA-binding domain-containing protein [Halomarina sp. BND7]